MHMRATRWLPRPLPALGAPLPPSWGCFAGPLVWGGHTSVPPETSQARSACRRLIGCRGLLRVALPRLPLVFRGVRSLFTPAEKKRWRCWHLSAPWRYSCCPASPAAQVAAWPELVSGELLSHDWWCVAGGRDAGEAGVWAFFLQEAGGLGARRPKPPRTPAPHVYPAARL